MGLPREALIKIVKEAQNDRLPGESLSETIERLLLEKDPTLKLDKGQGKSILVQFETLLPEIKKVTVETTESIFKTGKLNKTTVGYYPKG